jgi:Zn-dependent protease
MFDIADTIQRLSLIAVPFLLGITCHEVAHGYVSWLMGDPTAKDAGRLSLNPVKHLDFMGTLVLVVTQMIGWAKPVPIDPRYYRNPRKGIVLVSLAGPAANIVLALLFYALLSALGALEPFMSRQTAAYLVRPLGTMFVVGVQINLILAVFNLIPIPPLDGSKVLGAVLPLNAAWTLARYEKYGFFIILLLAVTGLLGKILAFILNPILNLLFS